MVEAVKVLSDGKIELLYHLLYFKLFKCVQTNNSYQIELLVLAIIETI